MEWLRKANRLGGIEALLQDVRFSIRALARQPGFALVAVLTLALGIGASTAIFSVVEGILLRPLPYPAPERLAALWQVSRDGGEHPFSHPNFVDLRASTRSFDAIAEYQRWTAPVSIPAAGIEAERVTVSIVSDGFFAVMGVQPFLGRPILAEDIAANERVAVVGERFWRDRLGQPSDLSGQRIRLGDELIAVVGVAPERLDFPAGAEVWIAQPSQAGFSRTAHNWRVVGRLREGVEIAQARAELDALARQLKARYRDDTNMASATAVPLRDEIVGSVRPALLILLGAAGLLLLIAWANVLNLLLARAAGRRRELALRLALGAGRGRLVRQFLTESMVLTLFGGALGVIVAVIATRALLALEPGRLPRVEEIGMSVAVLGFAFGVSLLASVALGILTGIRISRGDAQQVLADQSRGQSDGLAGQRTRSALMVGQVALTLVLLVGAGLLARSFLHLLAIDPGYRTEGAVTMELLLPNQERPEDATRFVGFVSEVLERVTAMPGMETAGAVDVLPLGGGGANGTFLVLSRPDEVRNFDDWRELVRDPSRRGPPTDYRIATADYFRTMRIPVVRGRLFDDRDRPGAAPAAVISETLARLRWPDKDPVGALVQFGNMDGDLRPFTIVGVVGDVRERSLESEPRPTFYANALQRPRSLPGPLTVVMSGGAASSDIAASARRVVRSLDPEIPLRFRTLEEVFSESLAARRFSLALLTAFAATALLLAIGGIYGVLSYLVAQRTREIGIRLALGADARHVLGLIVGRGVVLTMVGVSAGLLVSFAVVRLLSSLVYGVGTHDPVTFVTVPLVLAIVAAIASYVPARRAMRVDPMITMRAE